MMRLRMTFPRRRRRTRSAACAVRSSGGPMGPGARAERMLAARLLDLERRLDHADEDTVGVLWSEYYVALDLWLRLRMPAPASQPITKAQLSERFHAARERGRQ